MSTITAAQVKELRARTNLSISLCKQALEASVGDQDKAVEWLRVNGSLRAQDLQSRATTEGGIFTYVHPGNKIAAMVLLSCESDFVAKGELFQTLGRDIAMHIAASNPLFITSGGAAGTPWEHEEVTIIEQQMSADPKMAKKPPETFKKIISGKLEKRLREVALLEQSFVKDPDINVAQRIAEVVQATGENIQVVQMTRMDLTQVVAPPSMLSPGGCCRG